MKKIFTLTLFAPLILFACSQNENMTDYFDNTVFYNLENPDQEIIFFDGGVEIDSNYSINPYVTTEELNELQSDPNNYDSLVYEEIEVIEVSEATYEIRDEETGDVITSFTYDNESENLTLNDKTFTVRTN